jgi:signal transduction histidine kinase
MLITDADRRLVWSSYNSAQRFQMQMEDWLFGTNRSEIEVLENGELYTLVRQTDEKLSSEYLVLLGSLEDGGNVYMRVALESIRESAQITNRFFIMVSAGAILISILIIVVLSRRISRPIGALSEISRRMTHLDFDAKYVSERHASREIDELGAAMNEMSGTLEQTISELKTANVSLQQDIEKKEQIDEMRKEFLSNVSHELKTPLALIGGYAEGLKECINDDAESRNFYCDVIMDETEKMNHMVKQLLELNQLEFGNDRIEMTRFDLAELTAGVIQTASLMAAQKQVEVHLYSEAPVYVWGDEFKVEQVITNYLTNAINHAEGARQVSIRFAERDHLVRTSVFNTGSPIPEEEQDKIWIKFYKVDKARTREYGGSGIGLSIVRAIMDSFHQQCGVINHEDGVEFWMELESNN